MLVHRSQRIVGPRKRNVPPFIPGQGTGGKPVHSEVAGLTLRNLLKILDFGRILSLLGDCNETLLFVVDSGCHAVYGLGSGRSQLLADQKNQQKSVSK